MSRQNAELLLVNLLDLEQPYKKFDQLHDREVALSDSDIQNDKIRRIQGSLMGLAVGDALGASVEFRPNAYLKEHPVQDMQSGGTWGLETGQWTDDTSMALCLAASLIVKGEFNAFDQFIRYRNWYRDGYMSSTGKCFDIGKSTREAITNFENRLQKTRNELSAQKKKPKDDDDDTVLQRAMSKDNNGLNFGASDAAGNGPLMRLAPIPCFFFKSYDEVKKHIDKATVLTHGDPKAIDACQFYAGLIWHALDGKTKTQILDKNFYKEHLKLELHPEVQKVAEGSYKTKKRGYEDGIRGKGYVVESLEAALWAFYNDDDKFDVGVLKAVNLGDDTDTTAAIYGQLAGAVYGIDKIRPDWVNRLYQGKFIMTIAKGLYIKGNNLEKNPQSSDGSGATNTSYPPEKTGTDDTRNRSEQKSTNDAPHENDENHKNGSAGSQKQKPNILPQQ